MADFKNDIGLRGILRRFDGSEQELEALTRENTQLRQRISALEAERQELLGKCAEAQQFAETIDELGREKRLMYYELERLKRAKSEAERHSETLEHLNEELKHQLQKLANLPVDNLEVARGEAEATIKHNDELLYDTIDDLELDARSYTALKRHGINTIVQLVEYSAYDLVEQVRNLGRVSVNNIAIALFDHGLELREEEDLHRRARCQNILKRSKMSRTSIAQLYLSEDLSLLLTDQGFKTVQDLANHTQASLAKRLDSAEYAEEIALQMRAYGFHLEV